MRIIVDIGHPGHVHFFKNFIWKMQEKGHDLKVTSREKDVATKLLDHYGIQHQIMSVIYSNKSQMPLEMMKRWLCLLNIIKKFKPDIVIDAGGATIALPCKISNIPSIVFTDSEPVPIDKYITYPFAEKILTPNCFMKNLVKKQIRYKGYHEIAYLHHKYFKPDPSVLDILNLKKNESYFVLRFVSWEASHDVLQTGFSMKWKLKIIDELKKFGRVFISSERPVPKIFSDYMIKIPPHKMHDMLYYANLFMGDGATMATESALLGTPAIRSSSLVGTMGNFIELEKKYKLIYSFKTPKDALKKAIEILKINDYKSIWKERKKKVFEDKIDVTKFMINFIENYLDSSN